MNEPLMVDPVLTGRFEDALVWVNGLFREIPRKSTSIPYMSHLLAVAALVLEDGGDEDEAIAALLHDVLEDKGMENRGEIRDRFGERVDSIVLGCTDADRSKGEDSWTRKMRAIEHLTDAPAEVLRVSIADKLHNARSIVRDLQTIGEVLWSRFNVGRDQQLTYYRMLVNAFYARRGGGDWMARELDRTVQRMHALSGVGYSKTDVGAGGFEPPTSAL